MSTQIYLGVYRRFDYGFDGQSEDPPRALELHNRRKGALHDILDQEHEIDVLNWGDTDDTSPHEFVEVSLGVLATATFNYVIVPGLKYVATELAKKAVDEASSEVAKWLISRLRPKQKAKEILDFQIRLPDGTDIHVDPPDQNAEIRITFNDGNVSSITYAT